MESILYKFCKEFVSLKFQNSSVYGQLHSRDTAKKLV